MVEYPRKSPQRQVFAMKITRTALGEVIPEKDYVWITTITDIDSNYPDEPSGPGGWFPFAVVDTHDAGYNQPQSNSCLVLWRTAIPKEELEKRKTESLPELPDIMSRVSLYAEERKIEVNEALEELLNFAMDGESSVEIPINVFKKAFKGAGFIRKW